MPPGSGRSPLVGSDRDGKSRSLEQLRRLVAEAFIWMEALDRQALGGLSPRLTVPQCYALDALAREPDMSLGDLAARLLTVKSNASGIVERLQGLGLVERREDPHDARRVRLRLTQAGVQSLEHAKQASGSALARVLGTQDPNRTVTLTELLADLVLRLQQAAVE